MKFPDFLQLQTYAREFIVSHRYAEWSANDTCMMRLCSHALEYKFIRDHDRPEIHQRVLHFKNAPESFKLRCFMEDN